MRTGATFRGLGVLATLALAVAPWLTWFSDGGGGASVRQAFGDATAGVQAPDPSVNLWEHRTLAAALLLFAATLALGATLAPGRRLRVGGALAGAVVGTAALLLGRHVTSPEVNYVLRGYGATVYSGVNNRMRETLPMVVVLTALIGLMAAAVAEFLGKRR